MRIEAQIREMAAEEMLKLIPASEYNRIRGLDDHPQFRAYAVAHEGDSRGDLSIGGVVVGALVKKWSRSVIERIHAKLAYGTPLFNLHGDPDNSQENRRPIGEVVGRAMQMIGDKLTAIAIAYIRPEHRAKTLDIASIEADVIYEPATREVDVRDVTAIALGDSASMRPGFAGARLLAAVQEFATQHNQGDQPMTIAEIKAAIKEIGIRGPSELFTADQIQSDPLVIDHVRQATAGEYAHRRRTEEDLAKLKETMTAEHQVAIKTLTEENARLRGTAIKASAEQKLPKLLEARKLDERQRRFISAKFTEFSATDETKLDEELNRFLDNKVKEFDVTAELLGIKTQTGPQGGVGEQRTSGASGDDLDKLRQELIPQ